MKTKDLSIEQKIEFNELYRQEMVKFLKKNNLCIVEESYGLWTYSVFPIREIDSTVKVLDEYDYKDAIGYILSESEVYWDELPKGKREFYRFFYKNCNEDHRKIIVANQVCISAMKNIIAALSPEPELLLDFLRRKEGIKDHLSSAGIIKISERLESVVKILKEKLSDENFHQAVVQIFKTCSSLINNNNFSISFKYILENYVNEQASYQELKNLYFSEVDEKIFFEKEIELYEVYVDKRKIRKLVTLKTTKEYEVMDANLSKCLNQPKVKNILKILSVDSSYNKKEDYSIFIVRKEKGSNMVKEKFQQLLLDMYKGYGKLRSENEDIIVNTHLSEKWISYLLLNKELNTEKNASTGIRNKL